MTSTPLLEAVGLSKRYGRQLVVDDVSFTVQPGHVTGFLGPNGSGKSTTMRMLLGLDRPTNGSATVNGRAYAEHHAPMCEVGALLELPATTGIGRRRVDDMLGLVGLDSVAGKRAGGFSLGMGQRLGIATALLGDPATLILDEPVNGLDPEGILWIRNLLKALAAEGRTVFVSSHLMSEMESTADHLFVIGRGQLLADCTMEEFIAHSSGQTVRVSTPQADVLGRAVAEAKGTTTAGDDG